MGQVIQLKLGFKHWFTARASLTITAKASLKRHQILNDVWCHRHQSLSMASFVINICRHRHHHFFHHFNLKDVILLHARAENEENGGK